MFYGADKNVFKKAFMLRSKETKAEKLLWERLNKSQLLGIRFKRQHPVEHYVADFYCHKVKLVIELDGEYHNTPEQKIYDDNRTKVFEEFGLTVIRFSDADVLENLDEVVEIIKSRLVHPPHALNP